MMRLLLFIFCFKAVLSQEIINQFDDQGQRHGLWKGYYEDSKRLRYQGTFAHGAEVGTFTYYDNTKANTIIATRVFDVKNNSAYTTVFKGKHKVSEGNYIHKKKEGLWLYYHFESAQVMVKEHYKNDLRHGKRTAYYADGDLLEESHYKNDLLEGVYKKYAQTGAVLEELNYKEGKLHGKVIYRNHKSELELEGFYKQDLPVGEWVYYEKGKKVKTENQADVFKKRKAGEKGSHPSAEQKPLKQKPKS